jgi:hypothetical protein
MRKLIALAVVAAIATGAFSSSAFAGKNKKPAAHQHVEGGILIPQGGNAAATCVYRVHRALLIAMGENGIFGYTFRVDQKTAGLPFKLEVADGAGVDISFYGELGTDPTADAPANIAYETVGPGGEEGIVPPGLPNAMVCLTEGANATFTYMAGK